MNSPPDQDCGSIQKLSAKSSTALISTAVTPRNPQKNYSGQHFWPNLFLGRWLKQPGQQHVRSRFSSGRTHGFSGMTGLC